MGGKSARTKGHSFEREISRRLRELDPNAKRNVSECQEASVDILTDLPLNIQCKCLAKWSTTPHEILKQARDGGDMNKIPVGIVRITRKSPDLVFMSLDHFMDLLEEALKVKPLDRARKPTTGMLPTRQ